VYHFPSRVDIVSLGSTSPVFPTEFGQRAAGNLSVSATRKWKFKLRCGGSCQVTEARGGKFETNLGYIVSSRPAWAI
jgi:hypothetical protein